MKKYAILAAAVCFPLLGATSCNDNTTAAIKTIGEVANGSLPVACTVWGVAKGYFTDRLAVNSSSNITIGNAAIAGFNAICANPATTAAEITADLEKLNGLWIVIQKATTVPVAPPTPKST